MKASAIRVAARHSGSYGLLSAYVQGGPDNEARHAALISSLEAAGYLVASFAGQWRGVPEQTVLVTGITQEDLIEWGRKWGQEAVVWVPRGEASQVVLPTA